MNASFARAFAAGEDLSRWMESGVFLSPAAGCLLYEGRAATRRVLLSCGIHGDETAPIEMLDRLIEDGPRLVSRSRHHRSRNLLAARPNR